MEKGFVLPLGLVLGVGIPLAVLTILFVVFSGVRAWNARQRAALEHEGILLDTGPQWITIRFDNFRAGGIYRGVGISKSRVSLILTRQRLTMIPNYKRIFEAEGSEINRFMVGIAEDGALHIHTDNPPRATGSLDYRMKVSNAEEWVRALTQAGAQRSPS